MSAKVPRVIAGEDAVAALREHEAARAKLPRGRFGTCASEVHAPDCPRRVDHIVDAYQVVGANQFLSAECRIARIVEKAAAAKERILSKLREADAAEQEEIDFEAPAEPLA